MRWDKGSDEMKPGVHVVMRDVKSHQGKVWLKAIRWRLWNGMSRGKEGSVAWKRRLRPQHRTRRTHGCTACVVAKGYYSLVDGFCSRSDSGCEACGLEVWDAVGKTVGLGGSFLMQISRRLTRALEAGNLRFDAISSTTSRDGVVYLPGSLKAFGLMDTKQGETRERGFWLASLFLLLAVGS